MRKVFILCILLCGDIVPIEAQEVFKPYIVGFYNLENFYDTIFHGSYDDRTFTPRGSRAYTSAVFNDKVEKLATVISGIGLDISKDGPVLLGVSEVENATVLKTLLEHPLLAGRNYRFVHYDSRDFRGMDVALVYNPAYFKVERSRPLFVKIPAGTKDAVYTRDILWVTGNLDGEKIHVFVNHWPSRSGGEKRTKPARMAAALTVRNMIDSLCALDEGLKIIVMGDLNDDPPDASIVSGLRANGRVKTLKPGQLFNPWLSPFKKGYGTLAYQDAWSLFDQILLSQDFLDTNQTGIHFHKNQIFRPSYLIETVGRYKNYPMRSYSGNTYRGGYSDHFPVYVVLLKRLNRQGGTIRKKVMRY